MGGKPEIATDGTDNVPANMTRANQVEDGTDNGRRSGPPPLQDANNSEESNRATSTATTELKRNDDDHLSARQLLDAECERLLRNTKKQVKQMMEEAVTKKFIHEESSSIISLCVAVDACLSHQLKRRALGLFKTNSSTALVRKIAKVCPEAQSIISMVEDEERRQQEEQKRQKKQSQANQQKQQLLMSSGSRQGRDGSTAALKKSPVRQVASNLSVHKRHMWIKCALIERKLVAIVEHLAANASNYYEPEALMANCVSAQLLSSLLVGACALEFSRSKTNDFYQFEEPSADELLKRHKLSNPIVCLCSASHTNSSPGFHGCGIGSSFNYRQSAINRCQEHDLVSRSLSTASTSGNWARCCGRPNQSNQLSRSHTEGASGGGSGGSPKLGAKSPGGVTGRTSNRRPVSFASRNSSSELIREVDHNLSGQASAGQKTTTASGVLVRKGSTSSGGSGRRRPLALRTNIKTGALVTECNHSACQEISEHQQTRGYSFTSSLNSNGHHSQHSTNRASCNSSSSQRQDSQVANGGNGMSQSAEQQQHSSTINQRNTTSLNGCNGFVGGGALHEASWTTWSPRMLHETLHQNSKSSLLYAKNNVMLETNAHGTIAGYLSLHQTSSSDLILKWIPNQLINGGHTQAQDASNSTCNCQKEESNRHGAEARRTSECSASSSTADSTEDRSLSGSGPRSRSLTTPSNDLQQSRSKTLDQSSSICHNDSSQSMTIQCHQDNDQHNSQHQDAATHSQAIGSSYLDLVVNLSVSHIVLLHCHFNGMPISEFFASAHEQFSPICNINNDDRPTNGCDGAAGSNQSEPVASDLEETLVLVEADGVQRAPFRFPKGGLKWFLSCLENGLGPDRYLEPAIRPDDDDDDDVVESENNNDENNNENRHLADPLHMLQSPTSTDANNNNNNNSWTQGRTGWLVSSPDSPSTVSEPAGASSPGASRLEVFLRRLPSLRRTQPVSNANGKMHPTGDLAAANDKGQLEARKESPTQSGVNDQHRSTQQRRHQRPINYVYRIVSTNQVDWPQQTPPLSAFSIDSTASSGSFLTIGANGKMPHRYRPHQLANESPRLGQRFSWSLTKLARFSLRTTSTTSSSSNGNSVGGCGMVSNSGHGHETGQLKSTLGSLASLLYSQYNKTTLDSGGSLDSQHANDGSNDISGGSSMKRDSSSELIRMEAKLNDLKKSASEELMVLRNQSIQTLCKSMRKQILARAFYGWLVYCRRMKIVRTHLMSLINESRLRELGNTLLLDSNGGVGCELNSKLTEDGDGCQGDDYDDDIDEDDIGLGLTWVRWRELVHSFEKRVRQSQHQSAAAKRLKLKLARRVNRLVYLGGIEDNRLRAEVWPYLLGHYKFGDSVEDRHRRDEKCREAFESSALDWIKIERVIKERDTEILEANMAKVARRQQRERMLQAGEPISQEGAYGFSSLTSETTDHDSTDMLREDEDEDEHEDKRQDGAECERDPDEEVDDQDEPLPRTELEESKQEGNSAAEAMKETDDKENVENQVNRLDKSNDGNEKEPIAVGSNRQRRVSQDTTAAVKARARRQRRMRRRFRLESTGSVGSDASITDQFGNNIHRIDKDVQRCDRNFWYFKETNNLDKLRKIMCSYVWQHLDVGYVQGMCDLAAPLLVIFDHDELMAFNCFSQLMKRMVANFPHGSAMDQHFEHLKYLMQVLDPKLFEILQNNGDYTHFYFCYRWLLLDFKRELAYEDVYRVWEAIWSARVIATEHFVVFLALAMVRFYRDIIIENNMDFTDTIKFFNEMAERHDARKIIALAQECVSELENLIQAK